MTASICFPGQGQWRWWTVKGAYKWTATHGENHPTFDVYCTGTVLCETAVHTKYSWYVCMWYLLPLGGGAVWKSRNAVKKETLCACVCVCALSRWTYSRSGCLSELRPDRCGSNLRPYDVIDYLIFWRPTHRPPLGLMDTHTKTHMNTYTNTWRHTLRSVHPSTRIRADWFCWAQDWTVYPIGSEKMMGAENVHWYHLSCVRCWYVCVVSWNWLSLEAVVVLFFCLSCHPWCLLVC